MLGQRSAQWSMFEADTLFADFVGRQNFYGFLASQRGELFRDEEFAALYCSSNGRPSVPPSLLATALVLQAYDGVSDDEAKQRADYDLRWKVALGYRIGRAAVCQEHAPSISSPVDRACPDARHFSAESGHSQAPRGVEKGAPAG
jgi:transposase